MKVQNHTNPTPVEKEHGTTRVSKTQKFGAVAPVDEPFDSNEGAGKDFSLDISPASKEIRQAYEKARKIARETPDVREDKVRDIKEKIRNGYYQVDSGKVADGILKEALRDHISTSEQ